MKTTGPNNQVVYQVAETLKESYKDFAHHNKKNPLNELIFILCTVKTTHRNYTAIYRALKQKIPTFTMLHATSVEAVAEVIKEGGLSNQRAQAIKEILEIITSRFGKPTLAPLRKMDDSDCEEFLMTLPRVGKKVARCVMLYSLGRKVFPVDTHCWRICQRLGWIDITRRGKACTERDMDLIQDQIPSEIRFSLHVNMVSLGREICTAIKANCAACPIHMYCGKRLFE